MLAVGKTAWKSGSAIKVLSSQSTNTAKRAAKIAGRIEDHKSVIENIVATQAAFQGTKMAVTRLNGGVSSCGCQR